MSAASGAKRPGTWYFTIESRAFVTFGGLVTFHVCSLNCRKLRPRSPDAYKSASRHTPSVADDLRLPKAFEPLPNQPRLHEMLRLCIPRPHAMSAEACKFCIQNNATTTATKYSKEEQAGSISHRQLAPPAACLERREPTL